VGYHPTFSVFPVGVKNENKSRIKSRDKSTDSSQPTDTDDDAPRDRAVAGRSSFQAEACTIVGPMPPGMIPVP